jgi:hypothetical protein
MMMNKIRSEVLNAYFYIFFDVTTDRNVFKYFNWTPVGRRTRKSIPCFIRFYQRPWKSRHRDNVMALCALSADVQAIFCQSASLSQLSVVAMRWEDAFLCSNLISRFHFAKYVTIEDTGARKWVAFPVIEFSENWKKKSPYNIHSYIIVTLACTFN